MEEKKKLPVKPTEPITEPTPKAAAPENSVQKPNNLAETLMREVYFLKKSVEKLQENNNMLSQLISVNLSNSESEVTPNEALLKKLMHENQAYKQLAVQRIKDVIYSKVKSEFPDVEFNSFEEFPEEFHRLVCARVSPGVAYRVVSGKAEKGKPASIGKVNENSEKERDFYTSKEVDKLTKKQLSNPKVMETVLKSMLKW